MDLGFSTLMLSLGGLISFLKENMKNKIFPIILFAIFITFFLVFYKGLQNSNIYIPMKNIEKNIPYFEIKNLLQMI